MDDSLKKRRNGKGTLIPPDDRTLYEKLKHFFDHDDWHYTEIEDRPMLTGGFRGTTGNWRFIAQAKESSGQLLVYSILDLHVLENKRDIAAEYLTRANYGLSIGNWEMDYADGEVRYKTSIDITGCEAMVNDELIKQLVYINMATTDQYFAGLMAVIYGNEAPEAAIAKIENQADDDTPDEDGPIQ